MANLDIERDLESKGYSLIAGVDEVGRGPLAGPVVVASVIMPLDEESIIEGVDDSKKLSPKKRALLYDKIIEKCIIYKLAVVDNDVVDDINILNATKEGMRNVIDGLKYADIVLIDAVKLEDVKHKTMSIIHGDALSYSIACASIIAKVFRDRMMDEWSLEYPEYGFERNKGYGTRLHIEAIKKYGLSPIHRRTFTEKFVYTGKTEDIESDKHAEHAKKCECRHEDKHAKKCECNREDKCEEIDLLEIDSKHAEYAQKCECRHEDKQEDCAE
ncbi:MAG: ribonuclease HII [Clostridia bacterium]|nr:ribonuclease HII [Clostridia bacterium]